MREVFTDVPLETAALIKALGREARRLPQSSLFPSPGCCYRSSVQQEPAMAPSGPTEGQSSLTSLLACCLSPGSAF